MFTRFLCCLALFGAANALAAEEAKPQASTAPLVKVGRLVPEFLKWYVQKGSLK